MERVPLRSRAVISAGYDPQAQVLELEFANGRVYRYADVPAGIYDWLLRAKSKGSYVSRMINDRFVFRDVTPTPHGETPDLADALRASLAQLGGKKD
jgi:hypothetical protein